MLVDNGVEGDSRVQKEARSAAAAGWDVTLIGLMTRGSQDDTWKIGDAEVRLVGIRAHLREHKSTLRRSLRRPLAYPPGQKTAAYRLQEIRARRVELVTRFGALAAARRDGEPGWRLKLRRAALVPSQALLKVERRWASLRRSEMRKLQAARGNPDALLTKLPIRFWQAVRGERAWRQLDPALWDFEIALGKVVDDLEPDIVHANDYRMIGIAARAKLRAAARGQMMRVVWDAHEFVPGMSERPGNPRWLPAQVAHEREFAKYADAVVTVSPMLSEWLQRDHQLPELPTVVLNCPDVMDRPAPNDRLRKDCGVGPDTPLLGYCGGINSVRGVDLIVEAMPYLPDVHLALVSLHPNGNRATAEPIEELAAELGVTDRVHLLPYVAPDEVVSYLSGADAAVTPLRHLPNHEIALSNKFFEYSQARLPLITSDVKAMAQMVRSTGQGEVYEADDVQDYVRAVKRVLADPEKYRAAYEKAGVLDQWNWQAQFANLEKVYSRLVPSVPSPSTSRS